MFFGITYVALSPSAAPEVVTATYSGTSTSLSNEISGMAMLWGSHCQSSSLLFNWYSKVTSIRCPSGPAITGSNLSCLAQTFALSVMATRDKCFIRFGQFRFLTFILTRCLLLPSTFSNFCSFCSNCSKVAQCCEICNTCS